MIFFYFFFLSLHKPKPTPGEKYISTWLPAWCLGCLISVIQLWRDLLYAGDAFTFSYRTIFLRVTLPSCLLDLRRTHVLFLKIIRVNFQIRYCAFRETHQCINELIWGQLIRVYQVNHYARLTGFSLNSFYRYIYTCMCGAYMTYRSCTYALK